jgi:hypothetical protein
MWSDIDPRIRGCGIYCIYGESSPNNRTDGTFTFNINHGESSQKNRKTEKHGGVGL